MTMKAEQGANEQAARAEALLASTLVGAKQLEAALTDLRQEARSATSRAALAAAVLQATQQFDDVVVRLDNAAQKATSTDPAAAGVPRPTVYVQYADPAQKDAVQRFQLALQRQRVDGLMINAPGVEARSTSTARHVLRCFRTAECRDDAPKVLAAINALLDTPKLVIEDASARYEKAPGIRPRQYEVWFAVGEIRLSAAAAELK